jgi:hypothetical protein
MVKSMHATFPLADWDKAGWQPCGVLVLAFLLALPAMAMAEDEPDAGQAGRQLAAQLLAQRPAQNYTNHGVLIIKGASGYRAEAELGLAINVTATNWSTTYTIGSGAGESLQIVHGDGAPNRYFYQAPRASAVEVSGDATMSPVAGSDFWIADLGLEFLHWPKQTLLKKEVKRSRGCSVLESINPHPSAGGYARVVAWIDTESGGVVQAFAYDADNQLLKEFYPKDLKKVDGQWQVGLMEMNNVQTGSRTRLEMATDSAAGSVEK